MPHDPREGRSYRRLVIYNPMEKSLFLSRRDFDAWFSLVPDGETRVLAMVKTNHSATGRPSHVIFRGAHAAFRRANRPASAAGKDVGDGTNNQKGDSL